MLCYSGPNNRRLSEAYLEMMSHNTPHIGTWEFSVTEPWEVLSSLLETCCQEEQEDTDQLESSGAALGLQFLVLIFRLDLENYLEHSRAQNKLAGDYRPLLARVLCPSDSLGWCGRMKQVCRLYSRAVAQKVPGLPSLRCLVGLTGQLLQLKERTEDSNTGKVEMARYLAAEFHPLDLSETDLWAQLYLLEPAWLSALVSREMLSLATNIKLEPLSLRPVINNFLHVIPNTDNTGTEDESENVSEAKPAAKSSKPDLPAKTKPFDGHKKNKHGRTALHRAAKKRNIVRRKASLEIPGVDINCGSPTTHQHNQDKRLVPLIELSITKYITSNGLASIYNIFKTTKLEDLLSGVSNDKVEDKEKSLRRITYAGGFKKYQFGVRPRFDLYRNETVKVQDLRDYEKLINKKAIPVDSLISTFLFNLNICK